MKHKVKALVEVEKTGFFACLFTYILNVAGRDGLSPLVQKYRTGILPSIQQLPSDLLQINSQQLDTAGIDGNLPFLAFLTDDRQTGIIQIQMIHSEPGTFRYTQTACIYGFQYTSVSYL